MKVESLCDLVLETHGYQHLIPVDSESRHSKRTSQAHARVSLRKRTMEDELTLNHKSSLLAQSVPVWGMQNKGKQVPDELQTELLSTTAAKPLQSGENSAPWHGPASEERVAHSHPVQVKAAFVRQCENQGTGLWRWQGCHQPLRSIYQWPPVSSHHRMHLPVHTRFINKW